MELQNLRLMPRDGFERCPLDILRARRPAHVTLQIRGHPGSDERYGAPEGGAGQDLQLNAYCLLTDLGVGKTVGRRKLPSTSLSKAKV